MTAGAGTAGQPFWRRVSTHRSVASVGVLLGVLACLLALPPITARSIVWSTLVGILAVACGIWVITRGERRAGWWAVAAGIAGIGLASLAVQSSVENLDAVFRADLIASTLVFATPLVFAGIGGMFSERSGVVNIGLEGMMLMGAFWAVYGADKSGSWVVGILAAVLAGGLLALVHAFFSIHLRADQIVSGVAVNFLALGITGYFFFQLYHGQDVPVGISTIPRVNIPWIEDLTFLGPAIGHLNLMVWLSFVLVIVSWFVLFKTPIGLRIRACGEHPRAADTVGINVLRTRYRAVMLGGAIAGLGGTWFTLDAVSSFDENMTAGRGFIALAALIFGRWHPVGAFIAALVFAFSEELQTRLAVLDTPIPSEFLLMTPYIVTIIVVAGLVGRSRPPAADGQVYVVE
jgi:simple sugar transport system permease protein